MYVENGKAEQDFNLATKDLTPSWTIEDLCCASELLKPNHKQPNFSNEFDMRRIFTMVFDVYRRKLLFIK